MEKYEFSVTLEWNGTIESNSEEDVVEGVANDF